MADITVNLINFMGDDLTVVNAARVSLDKHHSEITEGDHKLISYLAKNNHWTPFSHPQITVKASVPIYVARQVFKSTVGFSYNEVSRRYVDGPPKFFKPPSYRGRAKNVKQGSDENNTVDIVKIHKDDGEALTRPASIAVEAHERRALQLYQDLLAGGVCPEQARGVLPLTLITEFYWTGSLAAFSRFCKLRLDRHAQVETRAVAHQINQIIKPLFPISWPVLMGR